MICFTFFFAFLLSIHPEINISIKTMVVKVRFAKLILDMGTNLIFNVRVRQPSL